MASRVQNETQQDAVGRDEAMAGGPMSFLPPNLFDAGKVDSRLTGQEMDMMRKINGRMRSPGFAELVKLFSF